MAWKNDPEILYHLLKALFGLTFLYTKAYFNRFIEPLPPPLGEPFHPRCDFSCTCAWRKHFCSHWQKMQGSEVSCVFYRKDVHCSKSPTSKSMCKCPAFSTVLRWLGKQHVKKKKRMVKHIAWYFKHQM